MSKRGIKDWLEHIQNGSFKKLQSDQKEVLKSDVRRLMDPTAFENYIKFEELRGKAHSKVELRRISQ